MKKKVELLAPVGSFESLKAAVQNGANAVYLGGTIFSARASAANFDKENLIEAVKYSHIRNCKVFVTVNTLIKESEKEEFVEYIKFLYEANIDALILQDIGMARSIRKRWPNFEIHASTQMVAHSLKDAKFLEDMGFSRVVLARELNIEEISYIVKNTNVDIEVFVHGALCVGYSGQCLMSTSIGTRSGNRGRCAQPCRKKYKLYDSEEKEYINTKGEYLLSPRDLNSIENVEELIKSGIYSFKIEGRMKKPEYVATVVNRYRKAMDSSINNSNYPIVQKDIDDLFSIFNRKFTQGYLFNKCGADIMNADQPNNRGLYIGKALIYDNKRKRLKIKLEKDLNKGDGLNIGGGDVGRIIDGKNIKTSARAGQTIEIDFPRYIKSGTDIYKTNDSELLNEARKTYQEGKELIKIPLDAKIDVNLNKKAKLIFRDNENIGQAISKSVVEKAIKVELSSEKLLSQISKLGNTPFEIDNINIELDKGVSMPISQINEMRRVAIEELYKEKIKIKRKHVYDKFIEYKNDLNRELIDNKNIVICKEDNKENILSVSCWTIDQLKASLDLDLDNIYFREPSLLIQALNLFKVYKEKNKIHSKFIIYLPRIVRNENTYVYSLLDNLRYEYMDLIDGFRVSNYGQIKYFKDNFRGKNLYISSWLNILNSESIAFYKELGAKNICISQEASANQISMLKDKDKLEYIVYGNTEMMISEYCPMGVLTKLCKKDKRDSKCNKSIYSLESEDGQKFRLKQDENCRTTIYAQECVNLIEDIKYLNNMGISNYEISLSFESYNESYDILALYKNFIDDELKNSKKVINNDKYNKLNIDIQLKKLTTKYNKIYNSGHLYKEID